MFRLSEMTEITTPPAVATGVLIAVAVSVDIGGSVGAAVASGAEEEDGRLQALRTSTRQDNNKKDNRLIGIRSSG
jgi:hypothetical protein